MSDGPAHGDPVSRRGEAISELSDLDVLVIGGGIVGAGIARDAALRGLCVGLVEQYDFASGTSSRSSRLLHGGLRYLAQGRVGLVREASREKRILQGIAPHLVEPLAFIFPAYSAALMAPWAPWKLRVGVKLYDLLCGGKNLGDSDRLTAAQVRALLPGIASDNLAGGVRYFDGFTNDARLVLDTLRSAAHAGAGIVNYCRFENADAQAGIWNCTLHDALDDRSVQIRARCVVNAAGPWAQQVPHSSVRLRLTKGVHLVIDRERLPIPDAVVIVEQSRILFAIPWGDRVILGTTDTDYAGPPEKVASEPQDVEYILAAVNRAFPGVQLRAGEVIATWAGLRPLIADSNDRPSDVSRSHQIRAAHPGWWDVSGGKLTTYRLMAHQTVDRIGRYMARRLPPCCTATTPLLSRTDVEGVSGILPPPAERRVVEHYCRHEWAIHLEDVMVRRTSWHHYRRDRLRLAAQVSIWMASTLGWSEDVRIGELRRYAGEQSAAMLARADAPVPAEP